MYKTKLLELEDFYIIIILLYVKVNPNEMNIKTNLIPI